MALTQPILLSKPSFDGTKIQTFIFNVIGGSQVVKNTLKIINNTTGAVVYQQTQTTFKLEHILPVNTLTNGTTYNAQIQTVDAQNNVSTWSNTIIFTCYTTPTIVFTNIPSNNIIPNSNYTFNATYNQAQKELLSSYKFILYDSANNEIATSGVQYVGNNNPPPTNLSHNFSGFENNTVYKIEIQGVTVNGANVSTGLIQFTASYELPIAFGVVQIENNCEEGYINIISNMLSITAESNPSPPDYIDNKMINVSEVGQYVAWTDGFEIPEDYTMKIFGGLFAMNDSFCIALNSKQANTKMELYYLPDYDTKKIYVQGRFYDSSLTPIIVNSNQLAPLPARDKMMVWVRRVGDNITIKIEMVYIDPDRTYTWYDVNNRLYTWEDINNLNLTWEEINKGGW